MAKKRILITGGSGFIGTNAVEYAISTGAEVLNIDIKQPKNPEHQSLWACVDILDQRQIHDAVSEFNPSHVIHLAARTDLNETKDIAGYAANIDGMANVMDALNASGSAERIVVTSTQLVCKIGVIPESDTYYCPDTLYGQSKVETENILRSNGEKTPLIWTILRPVGIWGPWFDRPYKDFFVTVDRGRYFHPGRRSIKRSTGYVGNTIHQIFSFLSAPPESVNGKVFYSGFSQQVDLRVWANLVAKELDAPSIRSLPLPFWKLAAVVGDAFKALGFKNLPMTSFRLRNILTETNYDTDLTFICKTEPYSLEQAVAETVKWLRQTAKQ